MGRLVQVREPVVYSLPLVINTFLAGVSGICITSTILELQYDQFARATEQLALAIGAATIGEVINRFSKSEVAIAQAVEEASTRLTAKYIQALEQAQSADLSVTSGKQLAELSIQRAQIDAETAVYLTELGVNKETAIAQLQGYILKEED